MARYTKAIDLYNAQKARLENMHVSMRTAHRMLAEDGVADARNLTAGILTPQQTRGAFARGASGLQRALSARQVAYRNATVSTTTFSGQVYKTQAILKPGKDGTAVVPALPVNIKTGDLNRSFYLREISSQPQRFDVGQNNPGGGIYRIKPGGTDKMVDSGFFPEIKRRWKARNKALLDYYRSLAKIS